ncbi:MAG: metal-dependent hydrolase [Candidatus Micrarchaeota archaeon]|nr:metal-dependent hydrolase [Candidatus Micrarchaeota archaeon]
MGNWIVHSIIGILLGILCILTNSGMEQNVLFAAVVATVLGSLIPDIDHKKSKIRNFFRWLTIIALLIIIYLTLSNYFKISVDISSILSKDTAVLFLVFAISVFIASVITSFIESLIPKHRGPIHRIFASLMYSFLVFAAASFFGFSEAMIIAFWGFVGYLSHIFMDILI